jgi:hypothetical protein
MATAKAVVVVAAFAALDPQHVDGWDVGLVSGILRMREEFVFKFSIIAREKATHLDRIHERLHLCVVQNGRNGTIDHGHGHFMDLGHTRRMYAGHFSQKFDRRTVIWNVRIVVNLSGVLSNNQLKRHTKVFILFFRICILYLIFFNIQHPLISSFVHSYDRAGNFLHDLKFVGQKIRE